MITGVLAEENPPTPGRAEVTDAGKSWPHEVASTTYPGKSMADLLKEIHNAAVDALATATGPAKADIQKVIDRSLTCLAYDGHVPIPAPPAPPPSPFPAHNAASGPTAAHDGAKQKVEAAYAFAFPAQPAPPEPPVAPNWSGCAAELDHGH